MLYKVIPKICIVVRQCTTRLARIRFDQKEKQQTKTRYYCSYFVTATDTNGVDGAPFLQYKNKEKNCYYYAIKQ